ncbi:biotin/lipoyl-containing protein [Anaerosalibacter sp. Marseille-P3206]|uniref:biotin/lipoyl-containing protein n=1 Tax=Anaerosalibacter sp. Marseille-P3206 TaxID=1871005 RepID=UPI0009868A74|nr:biotin/lipoyl-containing protein [Anaerosalibacter sp. Marseille-P3206]
MKNYLITVNGKQYEVEVEEISNGVSEERVVSQPKPQPKPAAAPAPKAAPKEEKKPVNVPEGAETVEAPMPGTILSIDVKEGDQVKAGQILVILEAMKMENEIVAPRDGKVAAILTNKGASVNTGDKLVSIE